MFELQGSFKDQPQVRRGRREEAALVNVDPQCGPWHGGVLPSRPNSRVSPKSDTPALDGESNSRSTVASHSLHPYNHISHLAAAVDVPPGALEESSADL